MFLQIDQVDVRYPGQPRPAVQGAALGLRAGDIGVLIGPSGCGKTTLLRAVAGLERVSAGAIRLAGETVSSPRLHLPPEQRRVGMVFQDYALFPHLDVGRNVAFGLRHLPAAERTQRVAEVLRLVDLAGSERRFPHELSGGQQQRVALARALAYDPPVLLMDEPLSALDKKLREEIQIEIRRIHRETGVTILYVTHDQEEALRLSDRIAVFNHGRIEQVGSGRDLYHDPATRFVASFIGDSSFLDAAEARVEGGRGRVVFPDGTVMGDLPVHRSAADGGAAAGQVMVRPQSLRLAGQGQGLAVRVLDVTFLGDTSTVQFRTAWGQEMWMRAGAETVAGISPDATCHVSWNPAESHLFL